MPGFIEKFAASARQEGRRVRARFSKEARDPEEEALRTALLSRWLPLPPASPDYSRPVVAVDGSQAVRHFNSGWTAVVVQALAVGPGLEKPDAMVRLLPSSVPEPLMGRYAALLMRYLEVSLALDSLGSHDGGIVCMDGSLQTMLPHLLYSLGRQEEGSAGQWRPGDEDLPLALLKSYLDLFESCAQRGVLLLGISKTSSVSFLGEALRRLGDERSWLGPEAPELEDPTGELPSDAEALFRWTVGPGFSHPLVMGVHSLGHRRGQVLKAPETISEEFRRAYPDSAMAAEASDIIRRIPQCSAMVSFHVRLASGEDTLRVDVPASALGISAAMGEVYLGWAPADCVAPVLDHLRQAYGGSNVYHAPAYVADRLVRLSNTTMDGPYLSVLRDILGQHLQYDRSRRRFL